MQSRRIAGTTLALLAALAVANLGVTCGPPPPSSDTCALPTRDAGGEPNDGTVASLEIGHLEGTTFTPFTDQGIASLQFGGQGSTMIVAHLRVRGSGIPACLAQHTVMETLDGTLITSEEAGLPMDADGAGGWISGAMLLVYDRETGIQVRLRSEAGGVERSLVVWIDEQGSVDAGVDAP